MYNFRIDLDLTKFKIFDFKSNRSQFLKFHQLELDLESVWIRPSPLYYPAPECETIIQIDLRGRRRFQIEPNSNFVVFIRSHFQIDVQLIFSDY